MDDIANTNQKYLNDMICIEHRTSGVKLQHIIMCIFGNFYGKKMTVEKAGINAQKRHHDESSSLIG